VCVCVFSVKSTNIITGYTGPAPVSYKYWDTWEMSIDSQQ